MIITIGREHGSRGHEIARKLAQEMNLTCYDKEIVEEAAAASGFRKEVMDSYDEKKVSTYIMSGPNYMGLGDGFRLNMQIATAQFNAIKTLADRGNGIFVGRCADYLLRGRHDLLSVFIYANDGYRIDVLAERYNLTEERARKLMKEVDKDRASYYKYYTDQIWGEAKNYDLCLDSSRVGVDGAVEVIKAYAALLNLE